MLTAVLDNFEGMTDHDRRRRESIRADPSLGEDKNLADVDAILGKSIY